MKCEHSVSCFIQDDFIFFSFLFSLPLQCSLLSQVVPVSCAIHPLPSPPLGQEAISGHAHNLILLMTLALKDHLAPIVRVFCYFQVTRARSYFPCTPKWDFFALV